MLAADWSSHVYQEREKATMRHPLLGQHFRFGQMPFVEARIPARNLRGDLQEYHPLVALQSNCSLPPRPLKRIFPPLFPDAIATHP